MAANNEDAVKIPETEAPSKTEKSAVNPIILFLRDVKKELERTVWPTRDELIKFTVVVMLTIVIVAVYLYISDQIAGAITGKVFGVASGSGALK